MNHIRMPKMGGEALSIVFAGVPKELRGHGVGKMITQQVVATGRERKNIAVVTLSALPGAVDFWERCGFVAFPDAMEVEENLKFPKQNLEHFVTHNLIKTSLSTNILMILY